MTWTRLERAALDYVIAGLARDGIVYETATADLPREAVSAIAAYSALWFDVTDAEDRIAVARLSLYLRLLRRVDAWERDDGWPAWSWPMCHFARDTALPARHAWFPVSASTWAFDDYLRLAPWRPLWLGAPPYDPAVTPRMRREARREKLARAVNEWAKANMPPSIEDLCPPLFPEPRRKRARHVRR